MPSQRTSAANFGSAQVIDASACTRNTPSNMRKETPVNQLQHPGFTAHVHRMPPTASLPVLDPAVSSQRAGLMSTLQPQRYTDNAGASPMLSSGRIQGTTSGIADRQAPFLPEHAPSPRWPITMPSFPSCDMRGEAELNPRPSTDSTWPATELETLSTPNVGDWDTLCGEVELSAMPYMDSLWPFEGRRAVSMSNDDWSILCGEVEISTMQNEPVAWPGSRGVEGSPALTSDGNRPNGGEVTRERFVS